MSLLFFILQQKSQVGVAAGAASGRGDIAALKRENQELNARIKQLEREGLSGAAIIGAAGGGDVSLFQSSITVNHRCKCILIKTAKYFIEFSLVKKRYVLRLAHGMDELKTLFMIV